LVIWSGQGEQVIVSDGHKLSASQLTPDPHSFKSGWVQKNVLDVMVFPQSAGVHAVVVSGTHIGEPYDGDFVPLTVVIPFQQVSVVQKLAAQPLSDDAGLAAGAAGTVAVSQFTVPLTHCIPLQQVAVVQVLAAQPLSQVAVPLTVAIPFQQTEPGHVLAAQPLSQVFVPFTVAVPFQQVAVVQVSAAQPLLIGVTVYDIKRLSPYDAQEFSKPSHPAMAA
jgi:hypothetical protein